MSTIWKIILCFFMSFILLSCQDEYTNILSFEMNFFISSGQDENSFQKYQNISSQQNHQRVIGDPGTREYFQKPKYAYIYLVYSDGSQTYVEQLHEGLISEEEWDISIYSGPYKEIGDDVYSLTRNFTIMLFGKTRTWGRVYAAMSLYPLNPKVKDKATGPLTEDDVKNIVFDLDADLKGSLQDIYSTPYNYEYEGQYYGTVHNFAYNPATNKGNMAARINLILYHVASKVDLMWNVQETDADGNDLRSQVRITKIDVTHLYDKVCYLFRPNENHVDADTYADGYTYTIQCDAGTWWNGRHYFYAIPYINDDSNANSAYHQTCPLQLEVQQNGVTTGCFAYTQYNTPSTTSFVPWLRGNITITKPLEYNMIN